MKGAPINKENNYSLLSSENYKKALDCDVVEATKKYSQLILDYYKFFVENLKITNEGFSKFIIIRGLDTITNVFLHILYFTKNINLTYFHCQKSFYFYVEFVGQISDVEKTFLQLTSRDATTYVYKKTIYEINNEIKKNNEQISDYTKLKLDIINPYIEVYKTILLKLIHDDFTNEEKQNMVEKILKKLNNLNNKSKIIKLNDIIEKLYYHIIDINYFFEICILLIKKVSKNVECLDNCSNKFLDEEFKSKVTETPDKFMKWFIN